MVKIVTGNINSGKTTRIHHIFKQNKQGDGFIQLKVMYKDQVHRYDCLFLKRNVKKTIAYHQTFYNHQFKTPLYYGPYVFNQELFDEMIKYVDQLIKEGITPIYLDEIGMLEINQQGYATILKKVLARNIELIIVCKETLINKVIETFEIEAYEIIR